MIAQSPVRAPLPPLQTWIWQGHSIRYTVAGSGQPLLLIHGFGASVHHWRKNIPVLAAAGYRVFAIDLLGFGGSDKPAIAYSLDLWETMLAEFWAEHIQQPTVFVGNSIGALLSLMLVARHPELSAGGVLLNCAGGLNHRSNELNLPLRLVMGTFQRAVNSQIIGPWLFDRIRQKHRIRGTLRQVYGNREAITDELVDAIYAPACHPDAHKVFASILTAPAGPAPEELLPQVDRPLLVLWGEMDPWTPIDRGRHYASYSDRVKFVPIPQTGHCPHDEHPELVNDAIVTWLTELP
ncbi:alpha/beta fold hydrolase [Synechococcus sp. PCC 7336]|uniref:alpha/beta fold hydrolase n=1 Tax=Synechococcus sp. PCC 7336 TaxID=195250 RepID=UPI00034916E9|nr:alpha/beta fold hydrolase [Synechococcus sp. PCC 7336]